MAESWGICNVSGQMISVNPSDPVRVIKRGEGPGALGERRGWEASTPATLYACRLSQGAKMTAASASHPLSPRPALTARERPALRVPTLSPPAPLRSEARLSRGLDKLQKQLRLLGCPQRPPGALKLHRPSPPL